MKLHIYKLPRECRELYLIPISDLHVGHPDFDEDGFKSFMSKVKREYKNVKFLLNGDLMECSIKASVGDVYAQNKYPQEQIDYLKNLLYPYKDDIIAMTSGNHEYRIYKETGIDVGKILSDYLGIFYSMDSLAIKIQLGAKNFSRQISYIIFMLHGWSNARTSGAKINVLESLDNIVVNADIYIISHSHKVITTESSSYFVDPLNNVISERVKYYVMSGSFQKYGNHYERKGYKPSRPSCPVIFLNGRKKQVKVFHGD